LNKTSFTVMLQVILMGLIFFCNTTFFPACPVKREAFSINDFLSGIVPKKPVPSNCIRRHISLHFERRYAPCLFSLHVKELWTWPESESYVVRNGSHRGTARHTRRTVTLRPNAQYQALKQRRAQENTKEFKQVYSKRAGIEGTISQGVRVMGLRRSRSIGQEKTHLQHVATAAALNVVRTLAWFHGDPRAQTRRSTFARLYDAA
jgi:hypothetical protein